MAALQENGSEGVQYSSETELRYAVTGVVERVDLFGKYFCY